MPLLKITDPILRLAKKCEKFANSKHCPDYLKNFYLRPLPTRDTFIDCTDIVSIDFETTGIDPLADYVLSIGGIEINHGAIDFSTSFHYYVNNSSFIKKDAAIINQITPEQLLEGKDPKVAMLDLLDKIAGKIVLVHCQYIESNFIKQTLGLRARDPLPFIILDTMNIERKLNHSESSEDVRLVSIRERRKLPTYEAHNALVDSLSTAEVLLCQIKDIFGKRRPSLAELYKRSK